jgi:electron transfer flavoprotein alpha subunit
MALILVIGEQAHGHLKKATLSALTAAQQLAQKNGGQVQGMLIGAGAQQAAQELSASVGVVHAIEGTGLEHALAETHAAAAAEAAKKLGATDVVIAATTYGKDIGPRIAAKLGAGIASDVLAVVSASQFKRAMCAGNAVATVEVVTPVKVVTVRATEFARAESVPGSVRQLAVRRRQDEVRRVQQVKSARPG